MLRAVLLFLVLALAVAPFIATVGADHAPRESIPVIWPNSRSFFAGMTYGSFCSPRNNTADITRTFNLCRRVGADVRWSYCWTSQSRDFRSANVPGFNNPGPASAQNRLVRGRAYACSDAVNISSVVIVQNADGTLTASWRTGINANAVLDVSRDGFSTHVEDSREVRVHSLSTRDRLTPGVYSVQLTSHSSVTGRSETSTNSFTVAGGGGSISVDLTAPLDGAIVQFNPRDSLVISGRPSGSSAAFTLEYYIDGTLAGSLMCSRGNVCTFRAAIPPANMESYNVSVIASDGMLRAMDYALITVSKRVPLITISGPASAVYGTGTTVSCSARDAVSGDITMLASLSIDGRPADILDSEHLGVGSYNYVCSTPETDELAAASASHVLTISQATPSVSLTLNGMARDVTVRSGETVSLSGTLTMTGPDTGMLRLIIDGSEVMNGLNSFSRNQVFADVGVHTVSASFDGSQNYTAASVTRSVTVNPAPAAPVVTFSPPTPMDGSTIESPLRIAIESNEDLSSATAQAVDGGGRIRPTILSRVDARHFQGSIVLPGGVHSFTATARDVNDGLTGSTESRRITVSSGVPVLTFIDPTPVNDASLEGSFTVQVQSNEDLSSATLRSTDAMGRTTNTVMTRVDARNWQAALTLTPGTYTYSVTGLDLMGVFGSSETRRVTIVAPGMPIITFTTPPTPINAASIRGAFTVAINSNLDLSSATLVVNDGAREVLRREMTRIDARSYQTLVSLSPASYSYSVTGVSLMGVEGVSPLRSVTVIPGAPTLTFAPPTPANYSVVQGSFTVSITSDLDLASASITTRNEAGVESTMPMSRVDARNYQIILSLARGDYNYYVSAIDAMGAVALTETRFITISEVQVEHTFAEYAFGGLVSWQRTLMFPGLPWPPDPRALFVGTRAAPGVQGGTVQRSYDGVNWETVFNAPDRLSRVEGVYSMYADPNGWIYAGFGGWESADGAHALGSRTGATPWDVRGGGASNSYRISTIASPSDYMHWGTEFAGYWEYGLGYYYRDINGQVVKIIRTATDTFYVTNRSDFYHTVPGLGYPYDDLVYSGSLPFRGTLHDAVLYNGVIYLDQIDALTGRVSLYSTTDGVAFTQIYNFDRSVSAVKGFFVASDGKLYFATSSPNGSRLWSINPAGEITNEFRVMTADEVDYIAEFNNYLYLAGVNDGTLTLYRTINTIR